MAAESSSPLEESKSSSDETDKSEQNYEYLGTGRSYECVFCKRGFTTAQALGGHMNIHRKHRAPKIMITNPSNHNNFSADHHHHQDPSVSSNLTAGNHHHHHHQYHHEGYANFRSFLAIQSYPSTVHYFGHQDDHHQVHVNFQTNYNNSFSSTANWNNDNCSPSTRPNYSVQGFNYSRYDRINNIRNYDLLRDNWSGTALSLGLNHGAPGNEEEDDDEDEDHDHNSQKIICGDFKKKCVEIDLELRLGFDP